MRERKDLEEDANRKGATPQFILEVLMDIRDLLTVKNKNKKDD